MSLPAWAMAPDSGARKPILIGAWAAAWWNRPSHVTRASETNAMGSRIRISSVSEKTRSRQPRRHGGDPARSGGNGQTALAPQLCARGRGRGRARAVGRGALPTLPDGTLHLTPGRSRLPDAIERVFEGAGLPANDPEGAVGEEARQIAKAPGLYTGEPAAQGQVDRRERPALAHVPHHPAKVRALQAGPRDAMEDGERGIVRHGAARREHPSHDVAIFLAESAGAHRSQPRIEAIQGEKGLATEHHVGAPDLRVSPRGNGKHGRLVEIHDGEAVEQFLAAQQPGRRLGLPSRED